MIAGFTEINGSDRACGTKTNQGGICAILPESVHFQGVTEYNFGCAIGRLRSLQLLLPLWTNTAKLGGQLREM